MQYEEPYASPVRLEERARILVVTINRPGARNALNAEVAEGIAAGVDALDASPDLRAAVLTGAGGHFSAGMDLKAFAAGETPFINGRGLCGITMTPPRKPLIAAVEGWALAGGFELVLACDLVVMAMSARVGVPEVRRGLVAAAGGAFMLPKRLPTAVAMELLLTGADITARRAYELGLANRVVEDGRALDEALVLAEQIARAAPVAVEVTKQIARSTDSWPSTPDGWQSHDAAAERAMTSVDALEGARAFAERRPPVWQGR